MKPRGNRQQGFILVATIWIVALVAFGATSFTVWTSRNTEQARLLRERAEAERLMLDTRSALTFLFVTQPLSNRGLELAGSLNEARGLAQINALQPLPADPNRRFLALDGQPYRSRDGLIVRLQDERGLFNLNFATRDDLLRLLAMFDVPPERRDPLIAKLQDYIDADDLMLLNGAEREEYRLAGKPPPSNAPLRTPYELKKVMGWADEKGLLQDPRLTRFTGASLVVGVNPATAPAEVLRAIGGLTEENARNAVEARRTALRQGMPPQNPFIGADQLRFIPFPSDTIRITIEPERPGSPGVMFVLVLTPVSTDAPWRLDYMFQTESSARVATTSNDPVDVLPDPETLLAKD